MSATKEKDLEIADDLAKGLNIIPTYCTVLLTVEQHKKLSMTTRQRFPASQRKTSFWRKMFDTWIQG